VSERPDEPRLNENIRSAFDLRSAVKSGQFGALDLADGECLQALVPNEASETPCGSLFGRRSCLGIGPPRHGNGVFEHVVRRASDMLGLDSARLAPAFSGPIELGKN